MIDPTWLLILAGTAALSALLTRSGCLGTLAGFGAGLAMLFLVPWRTALATWAAVGLAAAVVCFSVECALYFKARAAGVRVRPRWPFIVLALVLWPAMLPRALRFWFAREEPLSPEAAKFLDDAAKEFAVKQEALQRDWRAESGSAWGFDQTTGVFRLEFPDGAAWEADGQILGSYQASDQSWEWAWNNPHVDRPVARDSEALKALGPKLGIAYLEAGKVPAPTDTTAWYFASLGVKATGSAGAYRGPNGPIEVIIMLKRLRWLRGGPAEAADATI